MRRVTLGTGCTKNGYYTKNVMGCTVDGKEKKVLTQLQKKGNRNRNRDQRYNYVLIGKRKFECSSCKYE